MDVLGYVNFLKTSTEGCGSGAELGSGQLSGLVVCNAPLRSRV